MTKTQNTKRMFVTSTIAMIMCIAMLIGSTFAWFTDTKSTSVNQIKSGTLTIDLQDENGNSLVGETLDFVKAPGHESEAILWEPGATYNLKAFKVVNTGDLALKFKVQITGLNGDAKLLEAIDFTMNGAAVEDFAGNLVAGASSDLYTISGHMQETAGNEYQGLTLDGVAITVIATQDTVENDSVDNQYDANATFPAVDFNGLKDAITKGGAVIVDSDMNYPVPTTDGSGLRPMMSVKKDTTINLNGKTIQVDPSAANTSINGVPALMSIEAPVDVVINGEGTLNTEAGDNSSYGINVKDAGATLTINGGNYLGAPTGIQVSAGKLVVNGGFFDLAPSCKVAAPAMSKYAINCIDSAWKDGTADIVITGGTFVNYDPAVDCESARESDGKKNYLAPGYTTQASTHGDDTWYTVVPVA